MYLYMYICMLNINLCTQYAWNGDYTSAMRWQHIKNFEENANSAKCVNKN